MKAGWMAAALAAGVMVAGCEAKIGRDDAADQAKDAAPGPRSAEGKSEDGTFSIDAPGFDLKFNLPKGLVDNTVINNDNGEILYPGSQLRGLHVEGGDKGRGDGVELRFSTGDDPAKVAGWYRDPARRDKLTIADARAEGAGFLLTGTQVKDGDPFTLHLAPRGGGGTDGRMVLQSR